MPYHLQEMSCHLNVHDVWKVHWSTLEDVLCFKLKSLSLSVVINSERKCPTTCMSKMLCKDVLKCIPRGLVLQLSISGLWASLSLSLSLSVHDLQEISYHLHVQDSLQKSVLKYVARHLVLQWSYSDLLLVCSCLLCRFAGVPPTRNQKSGDNENLPNVNKTKQTRKNGREKGTRWKDPRSPGKKERTTNKGRWQGDMNKSNT
jgi:hypothetical protein